QRRLPAKEIAQAIANCGLGRPYAMPCQTSRKSRRRDSKSASISRRKCPFSRLLERGTNRAEHSYLAVNSQAGYISMRTSEFDETENLKATILSARGQPKSET
ncbi:MAG: hypothetical protein ABGZ17_22200, partial [Planctomycetaceae bacterium]